MQKGWVLVDTILPRIVRGHSGLGTGMEENEVHVVTEGASLLSGGRFSRQREANTMTLRQELASMC